jgi:peptide chain release factor subunit 1
MFNSCDDYMTENLNKIIRELSDVYDSGSNDTYVSLYLNKKSDRKFLDRRIKACRSILKGDLLKNFNETIDIIEENIKKINSDNISIFASKKHDFLSYVTLPIKVKNLLIVDSSPYIRPLARINDEWESFTLVLVSSNYAKIFSISLGRIKDTKKLSADIMNKHKKGGCSQARFNRLRKGAISAFLSEVVESLQKISDELIIIAGPGTAKNQFVDMLPKAIKERVVDILDINIDDENKLLKESIYLISEREQRKSKEAVQQLKEEILKDGLAVYGLEETLNAVKNGQVELIIIEKDYKPRGWICENCQVVDESKKDTCPYCGKKTSEVDVLEEILEFAKRTDADIEFTDDEEIANLGHIGGILRFK